MAEFFHEFESMGEMQSEIESAVRAAGGYVKASDDLRPRVLENARMERREWRVQRIVRQMALCVAIVAMSTSGVRAPADGPLDGSRWGLLAAAGGGGQSPFLRAEKGTDPVAIFGSDVAWQLVDSLTELRRRQADALHPSP